MLLCLALPDLPTGRVRAGVVVMDELLHSVIRETVYGWLDRVETLTRDADVPSRAALAEREMVGLVVAWRELLTAHEPDEEGRCQTCSRWRRRRPYPCSVWMTAHLRLIGDTPPRAREAAIRRRFDPVASRRRRHGS